MFLASQEHLNVFKGDPGKIFFGIRKKICKITVSKALSRCLSELVIRCIVSQTVTVTVIGPLAVLILKTSRQKPINLLGVFGP